MTKIGEIVQRSILVSQMMVECYPERTEKVRNRLCEMEQEIKQNFPDDPILAQLHALIVGISSSSVSVSAERSI